VIKIIVTGPESTGKTTLSLFLAQSYRAQYVAEYARKYLLKLNNPYNHQDLLSIAKGQWAAEKRASKSSKNGIVICDTSLIVMKIWSIFKYGKCDPWILKKIEQQNWDLFLLTHYDIPYEEDPLRENPSERHTLYQLYYEELTQLGVPYYVMSGSHEERCRQAQKIINDHLTTKGDYLLPSL
jgi:NadR type nicotinamide-nucleotide adenylyltransferase